MSQMGCNTSSASSEIVNEPKVNNPYFEPAKLGSIQLKNRMIMAGMSRLRADPKTGIPNDLMAEYYSQRAQFGAIITESSAISANSNAFPGAGGIFSKEQIEGWKKVTQKVHEKGGKILLQLFHCGRAVVSDFIGGQTPIAPSPIGIKTPHFFTKQNYPVPKEMTKDDIKFVIEQFKQAAINAKEAGFDGVQVHAANGYLADQFLRDSTNQRTDEYGGSIPNRARFLLEVLEAISQVYGYDRIGVRLTPTGRHNEMYDSNPLELTKYLLKELDKKNLAFVELKRHGKSEPQRKANETTDENGLTYPALQIPNFFDQFRPFYKGTLIFNDGVTYEEGLELLKSKKADFISFGTYAVSNPDLPERFKNGWKLADSDYKTYYTPGPAGYSDYPTYAEDKNIAKS